MSILNILGVTDIANLPKDVLDAGRLVDGMQAIYVSMPEGSKKEMFANVIAESVRVLLIRLVQVGAMSHESAEAENAQLPQEKRINVTSIPKSGRPKWMEESYKSVDDKSGSGESQEDKEKESKNPTPKKPKDKPAPKKEGEEKKVTMEDIYALQEGDMLEIENAKSDVYLNIKIGDVNENGFFGTAYNRDGTKRGDYEYNYSTIEDFVNNASKNGTKITITKASKKVTLEDIKALEAGDIVEEPDANVKYTVKSRLFDVNDKKMGLQCDIHNFKNNNTDKDFLTYWEFWKLKIDRGDKLIITKGEKPKYATIDDVIAMERGDELIGIDFEFNYKVTGISYDSKMKKDGFYVTRLNTKTGQQTENYSATIKGLKDSLDLGFRYTIKKGAQEPVTIEDIKALDVGDKIGFVDKKHELTISKKEEDGLWVTLKDENDDSEYEDQWYTWDFFEKWIADGKKLVLIKSKKPEAPKKEKKKKAQSEQVTESDRFKVGDNTNLGIIQEIWKLPDGSGQNYQYRIDGRYYAEKLVTEKFPKPTDTPAPMPSGAIQKGRKKKSEQPDADSEVQTKKLLERLKDIDF